MNSSNDPANQPSSPPSLDVLVTAVLNTIEHPDLVTVLNDIGVVVSLIKQNGGLHPSALSLLKSIL